MITWIRQLLDSVFNQGLKPMVKLPVVPSTHRPVMPPPIKVDPMSVALYYRGTANHEVVREAFDLGQWCGSHNMNVRLRTPGDGTLRILFESDEEEFMFRVAWVELIDKRGPKFR